MPYLLCQLVIKCTQGLWDDCTVIKYLRVLGFFVAVHRTLAALQPLHYFTFIDPTSALFLQF